MKKRIIYRIRLTACMSCVLVCRENPDDADIVVGAYNALSEAKASIIRDFREAFNSDDYFYVINCSKRAYRKLSYVVRDLSYKELTSNE